ncbi:glycerol dehydrogenase [Desulfovibrio sp. OttesenSCG-928-G15]|nr:glycerol dehydrogenase [Desulfovibrio sp. OttesenSCG-928-G15]
MKRVIYSPSKYIQGPHLLEDLHGIVSMLGTQGAYAVVGPSALAKYRGTIESSFTSVDGGFKIQLESFSGECCKKEINRVMEAVKTGGFDVIMGIGGGKTLDTAKAVAHYLQLPVVIIPTAASSDAPCSALSVIYTESGAFEEYLILKNNPDVVLVDTQVVAEAPVRLLVAGIGDALATYYEARACMRSGATSIAGGQCSVTALSIGKACLDTLLSNGYLAKLSAENKAGSTALENVVEANTYLSGIGFESGGLAAAHAVHNGFTVLSESHHALHGEKVAFGTLVHLILENAPCEEVESIITFCKQIGLPTTLAAIGISNPTQDKIMAVAKAACAENDTMHNMPFSVTPEAVYSAILVADKLGA